MGYAFLRGIKGRSSPSPGRGEVSSSSGKRIQIGADKHRVQAILILPETAVHGFPVSKLAFDDSEDMLRLAAYRGFEIFDMPLPVDGHVRNPRTWAAVDAVINTGKMGVIDHFRPFLDAQISGISINNLVILTDQINCLRNIRENPGNCVNLQSGVE